MRRTAGRRSSGDVEGAAAEFTSALELEGLSEFDKAKAHGHRGSARSALGKKLEAPEDFQESHELFPKQKQAAAMKAFIKKHLKRL